MTTRELLGYAALIARGLVSMCVAGFRARNAARTGPPEHPHRNTWTTERIEA